MSGVDVSVHRRVYRDRFPICPIPQRAPSVAYFLALSISSETWGLHPSQGSTRYGHFAESAPHLRIKTPPLMSACCITGRSSPGELRTPTSPYGRQPQRIMAGSIACAMSAVTSGGLRTYLAKGPVHYSRTLSLLRDFISSRGVVFRPCML